MNVEGVLARLQGVRRNGSGWMARCPAHEDRNPSLSITERDGRVLLHCHAGCTVEAVCAALKIEMRDLFAGPRVIQKQHPPIVRDVHKQIAGLRSRLTPAEQERPITVVLADPGNPDPAIARALSLSVEGEIVQLALKDGAQ